MIQFDPEPSEHPECAYCREFLSPSARQSNSPWNTPILESENFVVVPTLGHLVPGWLLLLPRKHYICLGALPTQLIGELLFLKREAESLLGSLYRPPIKFEHGACSYGLAGACIDHAHLHFVPIEQDFIADLDARFTHRRIQGLGELSSEHTLGRPYFFYENADGVASLYEISVIPSQFARMLVARRLGTLDKYDWRLHPGEQELQTFLQDLGRWRDWRGHHELFA